MSRSNIEDVSVRICAMQREIQPQILNRKAWCPTTSGAMSRNCRASEVRTMAFTRLFGGWAHTTTHSKSCVETHTSEDANFDKLPSSSKLLVGVCICSKTGHGRELVVAMNLAGEAMGRTCRSLHCRIITPTFHRLQSRNPSYPGQESGVYFLVLLGVERGL